MNIEVPIYVFLFVFFLATLWWLYQRNVGGLGRKGIRKAGLLETWYCAAPVSHLFSLAVVAKNKGIGDDVIKATLVNVCVQYPRLACRYNYSGKTPIIVPVERFTEERIPIRFVEKNGLSLSAIIDNEFNTPFNERDETLPLWRFLVVRDKENNSNIEYVAIFHHFLADGMSGLAFFNCFFENLSAPKNSFKDLIIKRHTIGPYLEEKVNTTPPFELVFKEALASQPPKTYYQGPEVHYEPNQLKTKTFHFIPLTDSQFASFVARCKQEQTSVQGALMAATKFVIGMKTKFLYAEIKTIAPISLRKYGRIDSKEIGAYLCGSSYQIKLSDRLKFWDIAREAREKMTAALPEQYQIIGLLKFVDIRAYAKGVTKGTLNNRVASTEVSNLGKDINKGGMGRKYL